MSEIGRQIAARCLLLKALTVKKRIDGVDLVEVHCRLCVSKAADGSRHGTAPAIYAPAASGDTCSGVVGLLNLIVPPEALQP